MAKISFEQFWNNPNEILTKVKDDITEATLGTIPVRMLNGHPIALTEREPDKDKGEDIFNTVHELFNPLLAYVQEVLTSAPNVVLSGYRDALNIKAQDFAAKRGAKTNINTVSIYLRIATSEVTELEGDYLNDYNVYRYTIIKMTLDKALDDYRSYRKSFSPDAPTKLSEYETILTKCFFDEEDIMLNCMDVHAFSVLYQHINSSASKNTALPILKRITSEMIQKIHVMTDTALRIVEILKDC